MDELLKSIYNDPQSWTLSEFTFDRGPYHIWIANGRGFVKPYHSPRLHFSYLDKWRFWKAFKWWCKNKPLEE